MKRRTAPLQGSSALHFVLFRFVEFTGGMNERLRLTEKLLRGAFLLLRQKHLKRNTESAGYITRHVQPDAIIISAFIPLDRVNGCARLFRKLFLRQASL